MSSWVGDWERNLIPGARRGKAGEKDYRTQCKLGGEMMLKGTPARWLKDPLGLSCEAHAQERQEDLANQRETVVDGRVVMA